MTFDEMMTFVRTQADADATDAPTTSLTVYARIAYNDILSRRTSWPHLAVQYVLTTIGGTDEYVFNGPQFSGTDLDRIVSIQSLTNLGTRLVYMTATDAVLWFGSPSAPQATQATAYTIIRDKVLKLYPKPASATTYTVSGFKEATSWPAAVGSSPDLPRVFDEAICWYMLSKYYAGQEDQAMAAMYLNEYEMLANNFVKSEATRRVKPRPSLMGGNNRNVMPTWMDRARAGAE